MLICDNPECKIWFHGNHLIDDYLIKTYKRLVGDVAANGVAKSSAKKTKTPIYKGSFKAAMQEDNEGGLKIVITDLRPSADPKTWKENLLCPKCDTPFE